jgi:hypothetical protein
MSAFTIESADFKKSFQGKNGGEFAVYEVQFKGNDGAGTAEMVQKASSPAPSGEIDGTLEQTQFGWKLKRAFSPNGGGGRSFGKSPEERAQIARMNSHGHALAYWRLKHEADPSFRFEGWGDYLKIVDLFFTDITAAKS